MLDGLNSSNHFRLLTRCFPGGPILSKQLSIRTGATTEII
jgi:hypothetical protein